MFTGRRAFSGAAQAALVAEILRDTPTPVQEISPNVPEHVSYIVETCLAKDPEDRWQTARDLLRELRRVTAAPRTATGTSAHRGLEASPTATRTARILALATVTAAAVTGLAVWGFSRSREQTPPVSASVRFQISTPETSEPFSLALSPDGRQLAYVGMSDGAQKIWVRGLDQIEATPLRGTDGAIYPFWSPDGKSLGFFADGKLKRVEVTGGEPLVLATAPIARGGSWSRSGVIVFAPTVAGGLQQVSASGGNVVAATKLQTNENSHRWPQFIDDRRFLFQSAQSEGRGLFIASLDDGNRVRVSSDEEPTLFVPPNTLLVVRRGALFSLKFDATRGSVSADPVQVVARVGVDVSYVRGAFTAANDILAYRPSAAERRTLVWLDRTGKVLETIGAPDDNGAAGPDLTSDGRRLVEQRTIDGNTDLWLLETDTGVLGRFTFDDAFDTLGIWSSDAKHVYFLSSRNRTFDIFEKLAGGGKPERPLLRSSEAKSPTSVSPDNTVLIYQSQSPKTGIDILGLPIRDPDPKPFPIVQTDFDEMAGQLSPDGRWLAYQSNASGRMEVRLRQFGGTGIERQVSTAGGSQARWARNGKELFYVTPDGWLTAVPIQAGADVSSLVVGAPHPLFKSHLAHGFNVYPAGGTHPQYAVAPDGRFLAVMQVEGAPPPPVIVVTNALPR
jgi:Tol biopolymer transport system component